VTPSISKKVFALSGGNQQKLMVAEWFGIRPRVIIFDEPTRGVDVGAKAEIYRKLREFASSGVGIIIISSDLPELIGMCDRILVMHQGRISGEVRRQEFSEELILSYAAGLNGLTTTEER
jgi:ribose transport system ATP-binding protein